jgi:4-hydroxy-4-methyl-2-oxoglutarate aldolase
MTDHEMSLFAQYGVATIYEAAGRIGLIDIPLTQVIPGSRVAGPARTVQCGQADNLMVHAAIAQLQPGEVLVLTMPEAEPVSLVGGLLATQALIHHAAAVLIDASARDIEELQTLGLPIWTRWVRVRSASKTKVGAINAPVTVGGTTITAGDIIVLDADGAVAVPHQQTASVLAAAQARLEYETDFLKKLRGGALSYDLNGLRQLVENSSDA